MNCPTCSQKALSGDRFCTACGASLSHDNPSQEQVVTPAPEPGEAPSFRVEILQLRQELEVARQLLNRLTVRVRELELAEPKQARQTPRPKATPPLATALSPTNPVLAQPSSPRFPPYFGGLSIDWENVLGKNWFAIVGAIALTVGVGFFLKLAFDNEWIGETGRIVLGITAGLALLGVGEYTERRYPRWAQPVTAGGITVLYLSIYAGFALYNLTDGLLTFSFLTLVVLLSALLALRYESLVIALLGIIGAFATPLLLGSKSDTNEHLLLLYIFIVDLGILGISTFRNWRWFTLIGMVGAYGLFAIWQDRVNFDPALAGLGLSGIFLVFIGATTLFHIIWRRRSGPQDMALIILNAAAYYALTFTVLWNDYELWFGLISLGISLLYGLVAYGTLKRSGTPPELTLYLLATAVVFLTIAIPLQFSGQWITIAWAVEGAVVVWAGFILDRWGTRVFGLSILVVAAFHLLIFDTPVDLDGFTPVLNARFPTFVMTIAAFYVGAYLYWRWKEHHKDWEKQVVPVLVTAANFFTLWLFSAEVIAFFDSRDLNARSIENGQHMTLTAMWALYAGWILVVAAAQRSTLLRWGGLALLAAPVIKLLLLDAFVVDLDPLTFWPVVNFGFLTFVLVLATVLVAAYTYWQQREKLEEQERFIFLTLLAVASAVSMWMLSVETVRFFDAREVKVGTATFSQMHLTLTVLWTLYAVGAVVAGIVRQSSQVRLAGIALMTVAVAKLFVYDTFLLERGYRVAAFVSLGAILLGIGLVYQRYSQAVRGFLFGRQA